MGLGPTAVGQGNGIVGRLATATESVVTNPTKQSRIIIGSDIVLIGAMSHGVVDGFWDFDVKKM
jgi:hypothetical protein